MLSCQIGSREPWPRPPRPVPRWSRLRGRCWRPGHLRRPLGRPCSCATSRCFSPSIPRRIYGSVVFNTLTEKSTCFDYNLYPCRLFLQFRSVQFYERRVSWSPGLLWSRTGREPPSCWLLNHMESKTITILHVDLYLGFLVYFYIFICKYNTWIIVCACK